MTPPTAASRLVLAGLAMTLGAGSVAGAATALAAPKARTSTTTSTTTASAAAPAPTNLVAGAAWAADNGTTSVADGVATTTTTVSGWSVTRTAPVPVRSGSVYTGAFQGQAATTGRQVVPYLYFYDAAGTLLDKVKGEVALDAVGGWTAVVPVVGIAPAQAASVALASLTWGSAAGEAHMITAPTLTEKTPARRDVTGPLQVVGNRVYDANGPVVLAGINRSGLEMSPTGWGISDEELSNAKRWGATTVRVPLASSFWLSSNCKYDAGYAAVVDSVVQSITSRGMVALLDLHRNNLNGCGAVVQMAMAESTAPEFWRQVAARYRSNPLVAFELYNEPHDLSDSVWLRGGSVTYAGVTFTAVGMQAMYDAVRSTGAKNLVVVNGLNWASTAPTSRVKGTNIAYGVHAYTCPVAVDSTCQAQPLLPPTSLATWTTLSSTLPVVMTEFGWPNVASSTYNRNVIDYAVSRGWGWTAFAWDGSTGGKFSLVSTAGAGSSYQPSVAGMPVLTALTAG